jgi:hypothetical protein
MAYFAGPLRAVHYSCRQFENNSPSRNIDRETRTVAQFEKIAIVTPAGLSALT